MKLLPDEPSSRRKLRAKRRNERLKLFATWLNAMSVALAGAVVFVPVFVANRPEVLTDWRTYAWLAGAAALHTLALAVVSAIEKED